MEARAERWEKRFEWPVVIAALAVIPIIVIEDAGVGGPWPTIANVLNWASWLVFLTEVVVMLHVSPRKGAWAFRHPLDIAIVLLTAPVLPLVGVRLLRLLRLLRLVAAAPLLRRLLSLEGVRFAAVIAVTVVIVGGAAFASIEEGQNLSTADGIWWAVTTVTTVGYGDVFPMTEAGRIVAATIMFVGIGFVALLTAFVADRFITRDVGEEVEAREDRVLSELAEIRRRLDQLEPR